MLWTIFSNGAAGEAVQLSSISSLSSWLRQNHSRLLRHDRRSRQVLARIAQQRRDFFAHWRGVGLAAG
jgi:hypothetical protein